VYDISEQVINILGGIGNGNWRSLQDVRCAQGAASGAAQAFVTMTQEKETLQLFKACHRAIGFTDPLRR